MSAVFDIISYIILIPIKTPIHNIKSDEYKLKHSTHKPKCLVLGPMM